MAIDGILLHQITKEMQAYIPAKINKIQQISDTEILLVLRCTSGTKRCMISLHSVYNRINISDAQYTTMEVPGNFVMLLRKQIDGGIIRSLRQIGLDRILHMQIEARDELGDIHIKNLYIELMGKYANMILVDEHDRIIDALKRIPPFENSKRTIHPGAKFVLPQAHLDKQDPFHATNIDEDRSLVKQFHGFSPLLAKEVMYRLQQKQAWQDIMQQLSTSSSIYITDIEDTAYFHCIPLLHLEKSYREYPLMKGIDIIYNEKEEKVRIKQQSQDLFRFVRHELHRNQAKLPKLKESLVEAYDCEKYRVYGDLLFSYLHQIQRQDFVELPSFEDGSMIKIPLDPRFDAKQNANRYYQKYHKAKRAQDILQEQILLCEKEIQYFEALQLQLEQASLQDAMEIREELSRLGYMKQMKQRIRKKKKETLPHFDTFVFEEATIYVGKNNLQNDFITWKLAKKQDLWLHAKDLHGSHVIVTTSEPSEALLRDAAMLAAWYSQGRYSSSVPVNYCLQKQLKKIPGNKGSFVSLSNYKTIYIDPEVEHIQDLIDHHMQ